MKRSVPRKNSAGRDLPPRFDGLLLGRECRQPLPPKMGFVAATGPTPPNENALITFSGDGHLLTFAPTGAGKGIGPVICNAMTHPGPLIVVDIKGEVYEATARLRRAMGQKVYVLDLRDGHKSDALNPLELAALGGTDSAAVARSFAAQLIMRGADERDRFWNDQAETLITGGCVWLLDDCNQKERSLGTLYDLFGGEDPVYKMACMLDRGEVKSRAACMAFASFLSMPDRETRPSVMATTQTHLRLFDSDLVRRVTDTTTVDVKGLIKGEPISLYITVPAIRLEAYRPLLRAWISGLLFALMQRERAPANRTLILCDELGNLGRIDALITAFTLIRSAGVNFWGFLQNPAQLGVYGHQQRTILDNAGVIQVFAPRNRQMAADYAALVGGDVDTIMHMAADEQMMLIEGGLPRKAHRLRYFAEPELAGLYMKARSQSSRSL